MPPLTDELRPCGGVPEYSKNQTFIQCSKSKPPCARCKKKSDTRGMKYVQPQVPASYKPETRYKEPCYPLESGTIYRLSYPGVEGDVMKECKPKSTLIKENIQPSPYPFSQDTTFRLSYTGVQGERAVSFKPPYRSMMGCGPMQSVTTQRHDYTPKATEKPIQARAENNICLSTAKMENNTTMSLSYQPVSVERAISYKPESCYRKSEFKLEQDTINRLSYQPWEPMPKEIYPWAKRESYKQPCYSMENNTIYRASYLPVQNYERMPPYKPLSYAGTCDKPFSNATIYRESYQDNGIIAQPVRVVRKENMCLSTMPMSQDTTFRLSYTGVGGEKAAPFKPCMRSMMGTGPMQSITTQRHDYTPKPIVPLENFKPQQTLLTSEFKMDDMTTFRASYLPNEVMPKTESYKPISCYMKSAFPLESETINRLSYQPWSPMPREEYPWAKKPKYEQPSRPLDGTSIYRGSYMPPGNYVDDPNFSQGVEVECCCPEQSATDDL